MALLADPRCLPIPLIILMDNSGIVGDLAAFNEMGFLPHIPAVVYSVDIRAALCRDLRLFSLWPPPLAVFPFKRKENINQLVPYIWHSTCGVKRAQNADK